MVGKISYPAGKEMSFAFMPEEKLSVYDGAFSIFALVRTSQSIPYGRYRVHGTLRYQACDNRQCYPPEQIPVAFDVKVQKPASSRVRRNPGQSPHVHQ
jgi:hypothetical protein